MDIKKTISNLTAYIKRAAGSRTQSRGRSIFRNNLSIIKNSVNYESEQAKFSVFGSHTYTVQIFNFISWKSPKTSCTCPFDWGGICKHEVAALLKLIDLIVDEQIKAVKKHKTSNKKRLSIEPICIENYDPFTMEKVHLLAEPDEIDSVTYGYMPRIVEEKIGQIRLEIASSSWQYREPTSIEFYFIKDKLYATCSCDKETYGLCSHQIIIARYIIQRLGKDYFMSIHPKAFEIEKAKLIKWAGIQEADFDTNFDFNFKQKKYIPKGKLVGLINFSDTSNFKITTTSNPKWQISTPVLDDDVEDHYNMGYILDCPYNFESLSHIMTIIGKETTSAYQKSIRDYYENQHLAIEKTSTDMEIIDLVVSLYRHIQFEINDTTKEQFQIYKKLVQVLVSTPYAYIRKMTDDSLKKNQLTTIQFSDTPAKLFFEFIEDHGFVTMKAKLNLGKRSITIPSTNTSKTLISAFLVKNKDNIYIHENFDQVVNIINFIGEKPVYKAKKDDFSLFYDKVVLPIADNIPVKIGKLSDFKTKEIPLKVQEKHLYIKDFGNYVLFEPTIIYDHKKIVKIGNKGTLLRKHGSTLTTFNRDFDVENAFGDFMAERHPDFVEQRKDNLFYLNHNRLFENEWFFDFTEAFKETDIKIFGIEKLKRLKYSPHRATVSTHIKSGQDWFDVEISLSFGDEEIKLSDLRKAVIKQSKYIQLKDGQLGLLPEEWLKKLESYFRLGELKGNNIKVSKHKFSLIDELFDNITDEEILQELAEKRRKIKRFKNIKSAKLSKNINAELRPYQKEGLNWLHFLDEFKWGGILADDMGLGKTVQVISMLQHLIDKKRTPSLVIVPTTLLFNWKNEFEKFAPSLDYHFHYGPDRAKDLVKIKKHMVTVTTYGVILRDIKLLKEMTFEYVILDESQAIKNVTSQRYKAVCLLKTKNRIAMTGTPIENNTFDLYAQMNFLNPGFLGTQAGFKRDYSKPIDANQDVERAKELQKMISPFVLRRTKEQVAKDLPPKIEDYIYVELEKDQRKVYDAYKNKYRNYLLGKIESDGINKSKMYVLEGLTKLRLICDSPQLIQDEDYLGQSAKIQELVRHITEKTANHKMLVFSQFTKMLALVKIELDKQNIPYEYLDGKRSQKQRKNSVDNFQSNEDIRVFLISLKAGNTGLNLTAADYVYLLDPWWNPAVESQAIDRTHRIGQDKHVIAYRMIAKDTIEEKIMKLQAKKKKIASDLIQTDESFMKSIKKDDIVALFS